MPNPHSPLRWCEAFGKQVVASSFYQKIGGLFEDTRRRIFFAWYCSGFSALAFAIQVENCFPEARGSRGAFSLPKKGVEKDGKGMM